MLVIGWLKQTKGRNTETGTPDSQLDIKNYLNK
jgi:hypothetical protein